MADICHRNRIRIEDGQIFHMVSHLSSSADSDSDSTDTSSSDDTEDSSASSSVNGQMPLSETDQRLCQTNHTDTDHKSSQS